MKRLLLAMLMLAAAAQGQSNRDIVNLNQGTTLPTTCTLGQVFVLTTAGLEWCSTAPSTWSVVTSGPASSTNNDIPTFSGTGGNTFQDPASCTLTSSIEQCPSALVFRWSTDTGLSKTAPGIVAVGNGTAGDSSGTLKLASALPSSPQITTGADGTLVNAGEIRRVVYKITVSGITCVNAAGFIAASLNADCVIATFPAKTEITRIIVDNTVGFTCSATCTGTKTVQVGKTAGGSEYLVAKDVTVIATYGLANADLGAALTTSATTPVGGGDLPSFSATTTIKARYVSGTGNWGNGATTTVNAGSTTFYIETLVFP